MRKMAELHLWMQAGSDQRERIPVRVESVDKVERSTLAVDCTEADFRTLETALYQVLHRTTNEPLRMVQQVQGQEGFEFLASDRQEIRSEKHVRPKLGVCSADQQHQRVIVQKTWSSLMTSSGTSSTRRTNSEKVDA